MIVALSPTFLTVLKSLCYFHGGKCKKVEKSHLWETFFTSYLHNGSNLKHNTNRFRNLQCRATISFLAILSNWSCGHHPNMLEWTLTSRIIITLIFLAFWSYKITFPFGGICRGPWHGPWRQCLIVYTLHTSTLFFSEPSTILLLKILKLSFLDIYLEPDNSNLELCKDHINSTQQ